MIEPRNRPITDLLSKARDGDPDASDALVSDSTVEPAVRRHVLRLLAASASLGDRFEAPAIACLGGSSRPPDIAAPSLIGRRLGPYRVVRRIGQGGMGAVYEAVRADHAFKQRVPSKQFGAAQTAQCCCSGSVRSGRFLPDCSIPILPRWLTVVRRRKAPRGSPWNT